MSLVPRAAFLAILDDVAAEQWRKSDRVSVAIPMDEFIVNNESQLLRDVLVVEQGLIMCISIPLATKGSTFTVFSAIAVPMSQPEQDSPIIWKLDEPSLTNIREQQRNRTSDQFLSLYLITALSHMSRYDRHRNKP